MKYYAAALYIGLVTSTFGTPFFPGFYVLAAKGVHRPSENVQEKHHQVPEVKNGRDVAPVKLSEEIPVLLKEVVPKTKKKEDTEFLPGVGKFAKDVLEAVIAPFKGDKTQLHNERLENAEPKKHNNHHDGKKAIKAKPNTVFAIQKQDAEGLKLEEIKKSAAIGAKSHAKPNSLSKIEDPTLQKLLKPKKPHCNGVRCKVPPKSMKCKTMRTRSEAATFADMFGIKEPVKDKWESCCPLWFCYNSGKPMFHRVIELKKDSKTVTARRPPWFFEKYNKHGGNKPKKAPADLRLKNELNRRPAIVLSMIQPLKIQTCKAEDQPKDQRSTPAHHRAHQHDQKKLPNPHQQDIEVPIVSESGGFIDMVLNSLIPDPDVFIELYPIRERGTGTQHETDINWYSDHKAHDEDSSGLRRKILFLH